MYIHLSIQVIILSYRLSFDAIALSAYILNKNEYIPFDPSTVIGKSTELIIPNGRLNDFGNGTFRISNNANLKQILIGNNCLGNVRVFDLDGLSELENMVIGERSVRIGSSERSDGDFRIVNCPKLKYIQIGYESIQDYHSFELNNLPSLQFIVLGDRCFNWVTLFSLTGLTDSLI